MTNAITFEGEGISPEKLPRPSGWRILIGMLKIEHKSSGGIILTEEHVKGQGYLRSMAKVLSVGDSAYTGDNFQAGVSIEKRTPSPWCKVGDIVLVGQYAGQPITCLDDGEPQALKLLNDDEVIAVIPDIGIVNT